MVKTEGNEMDVVAHMNTAVAGEQNISSIAGMARSLSHALNGTISVARGNLLLLKARLHDPESQSLLQEAMNALAQQEALSRSFTAVSYWEPYRPRQVALAEFFAQRTDRFAQFVGEVTVELADAAGVVWTDPEYLELAVNALITNACEVTQALRQPRVSVRVEATAAAGFSIAVSDNGRGIAVHNAGSIFDAGFSTKSGGHAGVGLWFVKAFAHAAGGAVSVGANVVDGAGSCVTLTLPATAKKTA